MTSEIWKTATSAKALAFMVVAWGLPVSVVLLIFWAVVLEPWQSIVAPGASAGVHILGLDTSWTFLIVWIILTVALGLNAKFIFRLYEGYLFLPRRIRERRSRTHWLHREVLRLNERLGVAMQREANGETPAAGAPTADEIRKELDEAKESLSDHLGRVFNLIDRRPWRYRVNWRDYPRTESQAMPTLLGNRIRQFERYGNDRFDLDILVLWYEFITAADDQTRDELENSRQGVETFVAASVSGLLLALASLGPLAWKSTWDHDPFSLVLTGAIALVVSALTYRQAVDQTSDWSSAVMSLVNMNRTAVANGLGFALPDTLEGERKLWRSVTGFVRTGGDAYAKALDAFPRVQDKTS